MEGNSRWSDPLRYMSLAVVFIALIVLLIISKNSLPLILVAAIIAYVLYPIVKLLNEKIHLPRNLSIIIAYLVLAILIIVIFSLIIPLITSNIQAFFSLDWPTILESFDSWLDSLIKSTEVDQVSIGGIELDLATPLIELRKNLNSISLTKINLTQIVPNITGAITSVVNISTGIIGTVATTLIMMLTTIMASFHFCKDGKLFAGWIVKLFPVKYQMEIKALFHRMALVWNNYFIGELKLMGIIGLLTFLTSTALGLRWSLLLGIIAGFCEIVPNIGPILACIPAALIALILGSSWLPVSNFILMLIVIVVQILIQQAENILIVPRVMGSALNLHPVIIILGILILSSRLGILGALFAAPIIGLAREILYFILSKIRNEDPYPELLKPDGVDLKDMNLSLEANVKEPSELQRENVSLEMIK